jgi:DNA-binding protein HU-beta
MTKAEIVSVIASKTNVEKVVIQHVIESFMESVKEGMVHGDNVYLRGFGSFIIKERKQKVGRNIRAKKSLIIPAHCIPAFKPANTFLGDVKQKVKYTGKRK